MMYLNPAQRDRIIHEEGRKGDMRLLELLHMTECEGMTRKAAGKRFGMTKSAVIGQLDRIGKAMQPSTATRPENRDGGMPAKWWAA